MWKCEKCKREFQKVGQGHSCKLFPLENHFKGKEKARELFDFYLKRIEEEIGPVKVESLPCCIHLIGKYTFGACWAMRDKIRIDFRLDKEIKIKREHKMIKISANRYMYYFDIYQKKEIDSDLFGWVRDSFELNK